MTPPARCADLIPTDWQQPVDAAPVPTNAPDAEWLGKPLTAAVEAALIAPWANGYVAQDGALAKANGRTADTISIFKACEAQVNAARPK